MVAESMRRPAAQLPEGWRLVEFGDVVRQAKVDADPETSGLERYVAGEHMGTDDLHIRSWGIIGDGYLGPAFHRKFVKGQVLYGSRRTYLRKVAVADFDGICANTTFVLEPKDDQLIPELLPFVMQTDAFNDHAVKQSRGSVNPYVNFRDIAWYTFALPPKEEQRRIADILWAADAAVERWREVVESSAAASALLVDDAMSGKFDVAPIGAVLASAEYGLSDRSNASSGTPIIGMANVQGGLVSITTSSFVRISEQKRQSFSLKRDDILFNRTNSIDLVGKAGIVADEPQEEVVFASYLVRLRANPELMLPRFLNACLNSTYGQQRIRAYATPGVSQANINVSNLKRVTVPVPPIAEQRRVLSLLSSADGARRTSQRHMERLGVARSRLLSHLLSEGRMGV